MGNWLELSEMQSCYCIDDGQRDDHRYKLAEQQPVGRWAAVVELKQEPVSPSSD